MFTIWHQANTLKSAVCPVASVRELNWRQIGLVGDAYGLRLRRGGNLCVVCEVVGANLARFVTLIFLFKT